MKLPDPTRPLEEQEEDVLLAMCIFGEGRGQSDEAKLGVANVVRTRVQARRKHYGLGWAGVILKPLQFSCFNSNDPNRPKLLEPLKWEQLPTWASCWEIARKVYQGIERDNTLGATHYFDDSLAPHPPPWAARMTPTVKISALNFFREA